MTDEAPVRSVARAVDILLVLTTGSRSLGDIAESTNLSKATVHRLLASLAAKEFVTQDPASGDYMLGPGCFAIVDAVSRGFGGLGVVARPLLEHLHEVTRETVTLHVRVGSQRICVAELPSPQSVRYTAGVGASAPIHTGSAGKLLLALSDNTERNEILDNTPLEALTEETITDRGVLERELERIRRRGYAESRGERVTGGAAVSAPILGSNGRIIAALSVLGPDGRVTDQRLKELRPMVIEAAQEISDSIAANDRTQTGTREEVAT